MILAAFLVLRLVVLRAFKVDLSGGFKKGKISLPIILSLVSAVNPIQLPLPSSKRYLLWDSLWLTTAFERLALAVFP